MINLYRVALFFSVSTGALIGAAYFSEQHKLYWCMAAAAMTGCYFGGSAVMHIAYYQAMGRWASTDEIIEVLRSITVPKVREWF